MRMRLATATFLLVGAGSAAVGALDMLGSDTMNQLTKDVITNCPGAAGINYLGTGSGNGEGAMAGTAVGHQVTSPMSRFLQAGNTCKVNNGATAEGLVVALDGVTVAANTANSSGCGGVAFTKPITVTADRSVGAGFICPGCSAATPPAVYTPTAISASVGAWADYLRVLFMGVHHDAAQTRDCDSDVRRELVEHYTALFEGSCTGGSCTKLHHLWRRDDASGTTDTFTNLLGGAINKLCNVGNTIPASTPNGFADFLDNDPIRVPCDGKGGGVGEQVCGTALPPSDKSKVGTLGLLLPVFPPDTKDVPAAELYPTAVCTTGANQLLEAPKATFTGLGRRVNLRFADAVHVGGIRASGARRRPAKAIERVLRPALRPSHAIERGLAQLLVVRVAELVAATHRFAVALGPFAVGLLALETAVGRRPRCRRRQAIRW